MSQRDDALLEAKQQIGKTRSGDNWRKREGPEGLLRYLFVILTLDNADIQFPAGYEASFDPSMTYSMAESVTTYLNSR